MCVMKNLNSFNFTYKYCEKEHCLNHQQPELHNCHGILSINKDTNQNDIEKNRCVAPKIEQI